MISVDIFQQLAQSTNDVIVVTAAAPLGPPGPIIVYVNPAFTALTGYDADEVIGRSTRLLHGPNTDPQTVAAVRAAMEAQRPVRVELLHYSRDGEEFWIDTNIVPLRDAHGRVTHFATIGRDLSATRQLQEELRLMASTDPLTGLLNRRRFLEQAESEFLRSQRYRHELAVVMLDVDYFKAINDTHGHFAGDQALIALSRAAENLLRGTDIIGRWGGEEFVILMPETPLAGAAILAERLREVLARLAIDTTAGTLHFTISAGVAARGGPDADITDILQRADTALYAAKQHGRNRIQVSAAEGSRAA
ncbi:MAG TPA: diguanylate cyclase [Acidiferrobacterales bacterium]|nr:diguanylate cyclase [Acidiferrobacterales bacterium]